MIEKKDLQALPFVDGVPDPLARPDQASINWMKNGECLSAAETKTSHEGTLNRVSVELNDNIKEIDRNVKTVKSSLDETIDIVNRHSDIIDQQNDLDLIKTVQRHNDEIETLNDAVVIISDDVQELKAVTERHTDEIGVIPSHDTAKRNIRDELEWQKTEMGAYPGFDYNGKPNVDSRGSGMKNRIINNSMAISDHNSRLNDLEYNWQTSDVGSLTREVQSIRVELGPSSDKVPGNNVYKRLKRTEDVSTGNRTDVKELQAHTGVSTFPRPNATTLIQLVELNDEHITALNKAGAITNDRVLVVERKIGDDQTPDSILFNQKVAMREINELYGIVGKSNSEGLRYSVALLETEMGSDTVPGTIKNRVLLTEQGIRDLNIQVDSLNTMLGVSGSASGTFADRVLELELQMNGDDNGATEYERTGIYPLLYALNEEGIVTDAADAQYYVRTKDAWVPVGSFDLNITSSISMNGAKFIEPVGTTSVNVGTAGKDINLISVLSHAAVRDSIQLTNRDNNVDYASQFVRYVASALSKRITVGDNSTDLELLGNKVTINGQNILENAVVDVDSDDPHYRVKGGWRRFTEEPIPASIVSPGGENILTNTDTKTTIGSDVIPMTLKNVEDMTVGKDFKIQNGSDTILEVENGLISLDRTLTISGNRVITTADDAPNDDEYYARYKGTWAKVSNSGGPSGGISDVPNDHKVYVRKDQAWIEQGTESITMFDELSLNWAVDSNNTTGVSYSQTSNKMSIGGSGARVEFLGEISSTLMASGTSLTQKLGSQTATVFTSDTDKNLLIGDKDLHKSVILRSSEEPQIQTKSGQYKLWHSGDDAKHDGQLYARKDGQWVISTVNKTQDVILNNGISFKVTDSKGKILTVATSGADNLIQIGEVDSLMNIRSTVRTLNIDNKVHITGSADTGSVNLLGKVDNKLELGSSSLDVAISGSSLTFNGNKVVTSADDAPNDQFKYVRSQNSWTKAYGYGETAPSAVGAKEGDIYFQYM